MAQRKSPPTKASSSSRSGPSGSAGSKPGQKAAQANLRKAGGSRPAAGGAGGAGKGPGGTGGNRGKGKSIVNQKQTPWGMISAAVAVVLFAAAIVVVVIATRKGSTGGDGSKTVSVGGQAVDKSDTYRQPELAAAKAIPGVTYRVEGLHDHVGGIVQYDASPPIGGDHAPLWADCTGVVYTHQLANENAVHSLEHGAVWVTYNPAKLSKAQIATLAKDVNGVDHTLMTPYAGLKTAVSLQSWGYQLFVTSPTDPRIEKFIKTLAGNVATWPEQGASCTDPYWNASKSKPGSPLES